MLPPLALASILAGDKVGLVRIGLGMIIERFGLGEAEKRASYLSERSAKTLNLQPNVIP